jgi:hypothetical protein
LLASTNGIDEELVVNAPKWNVVFSLSASSQSYMRGNRMMKSETLLLPCLSGPLLNPGQGKARLTRASMYLVNLRYFVD